MNTAIPLDHILFLDIETVPQQPNWEALAPNTQVLFEKKTAYQRKDQYSPAEFYDRAGIWAEFGKIVCISVGYFKSLNAPRSFRITSFRDPDEKTLLERFKILLDGYFSSPSHRLCAHNGKEFDFPYIARRMIVHQIPLPKTLNLFGKKPWEVPHIDTMDLWKFGDYKHYTSLSLLTHILNIPTPKDDIDGSQVAHVYYGDKDVDRIVRYCEKDTLALAQIYLRFQNLPLLIREEIVNV